MTTASPTEAALMENQASVGLSNSRLLSQLNSRLQPLHRLPLLSWHHLPRHSLQLLLKPNIFHRRRPSITDPMAGKGVLFWKLPMLLLLARTVIPLLKRAQGEDLLGDPTVSVHPASALEAYLEKDPIDLPATRPPIQSQILIPFDPAHRLRKGLNTATSA